MKGKYEYIIHHTLTLFLVISSLFGNGEILRFIPHLLISDTTNIFFNIAWIMRLFGGKGSTVVVTLEMLFALSFLLVRVINMPCMFYALGNQAKGLGLARHALAPIAIMQWYWFYKIARTIIIRFMENPNTEKKEIMKDDRKKKKR